MQRESLNSYFGEHALLFFQAISRIRRDVEIRSGEEYDPFRPFHFLKTFMMKYKIHLS